MPKPPTLTETVLDASQTRVIRAREDGSVEELPTAAEPPKPKARRGAASTSEEVTHADPT